MATYPSTTDTAAAAGPRSGPTQPTVQEFSIRVPKNNKKKYNVMRFSTNLGVNLTEWKNQGVQVKMERENNMKEFRGIEEETAKFGAGSEFGREAREEARRKKFGIATKKYRPEDQPWILKTGGKSGKKFKGIREGGVSDNTAYYVFTQAGKGVIEAYPLQEWYKFQPIQRYKALSAEEAEEEFGKRNKIVNYFSMMMKKRLRNEDDGDGEELEELKGKKSFGKKKDKSELKISEMDDWVDSDDDLSGSDSDSKAKEDDDEGGNKKKKGKGKKKVTKKKKKKDSDDEAFEESDDGDEEGRELDYISDSSESASDSEMKANKELKGVAEEDALRKLLNSESEDEDEEQEKKDEKGKNSEEDDKKKDGDKDSEKTGKEEKLSKKSVKTNKKKHDKKSNGIKVEEESSSELSPNSTDSDSDAPPGKKTGHKIKDSTNSAGSSRSSTPVPGEKRKLTNAEAAIAAAKKAKLDSSSGSSTYIPAGDTGVTEDAVRRYLMRKPMTTIELVQKFKSKKTGLSSEQLVNLMTQILKNINPVKQTIKNKMYLSLKPM